MPANEHSAQPQRLLKVGDFQTAKFAYFRSDPVPFDRPITHVTGRFNRDQLGSKPGPFWWSKIPHRVFV